jgi:hypothetical protein
MKVAEQDKDATGALPVEEAANTMADAVAANLREQRIADYMEDSLAKHDPLEANLGIVNADLMKIAHQFQRVLDDAMQQAPETLSEMIEFMPGIDGYLRIVKQVDRFSQLTMKLHANGGKD